MYDTQEYTKEKRIMGVSMIGIDHNMAPVDIRALFLRLQRKVQGKPWKK